MSFVCSLYSGSSGNSTFIGNTEGGFLVDIGRSMRYTKTKLEELGISIDSIKGVFITHEHVDHIAGLATLQKHYNIPIFASQAYMQHRNRKYLPDNRYQA